jgi:hypothetical protein
MKQPGRRRSSEEGRHQYDSGTVSAFPVGVGLKLGDDNHAVLKLEGMRKGALTRFNVEDVGKHRTVDEVIVLAIRSRVNLLVSNWLVHANKRLPQ